MVGYPEMFSVERFTEQHVSAWLGEHDRKQIRYEFARRVNELLELARVAPRLNWSGDRARVELVGYELFGSLIRQLLFAIGRVDALAVCAGCGRSFVPGRRPRADQRSWCGSKECTKQANRQHKRESRRRSKEDYQEGS